VNNGSSRRMKRREEGIEREGRRERSMWRSGRKRK
jgi:hypothetical protein